MKKYLIALLLTALSFTSSSAITVSSCAFANPGANRIFYWNQAGANCGILSLGSNLSITGTTLNAASPTGQALTKTDDTNVTATLGGSPNTALLNSASITLGWTGQLAGTRGGTGANNAGTFNYGANNITFSTAGATSLTLPTAGTLATLAGTETLSNKTGTSSTNNWFTLTTTGTSGAATYSTNTLNIPQYQAAGTYVTAVTGTTNRITSTGGTTPSIDISATFEALLGKVATGLQQFAATSSAQLRGVLSDETGTGLAYFQGGDIGTPSAGVATNITGLPLTTGTTGVLPETKGGTNQSTYTLGDTLYSSATNTLSKLAGNTTATKNFYTQTGTGTVSAAPAWGVLASADIPNNAANTTGSAAKLTTGRTIAITGDLAYTSPSFDGSGNVTAAGTLATVNSNVGSFTNASITVNAKGLITAASSGAAPLTNPMTTLGDIIYENSTPAPARLAGNITSAKQYLSQTGTGTISAVPAWASIAGADVTGAALTKTDDTNVTMTLGGTPTTALLRAASMTLGWTGQLSGARGGTGANNAGTFTYGSNNITLTTSGATSVTLPTSGTLATLSGTETLSNKTLTAPLVNVGSGTGTGVPEVALWNNGPRVGNNGGAEYTMYTFTVPASTLVNNADSLVIGASGCKTNNADTKTFKVYFGATVVYTKNLASGSAGCFTVRVRVEKQASNSQYYIVEQAQDDSTVSAITGGTMTETDTAGIVVKTTVTAATTNDVTQYWLYINYIPSH